MDAMGALALKISADAAEFDKTLDRATAKFANFTKTISRPIGAIGDVRARIDAVMAPITSAVSKIPFAGGPLAAAFGSTGAIFDTIKETTAHVLAQNRSASALGLTMKELAGFEIAAGPASDVLAHGLGHISQELGAVAMGSEEAAQKFKRLGLDGEKLAHLPFGEAVKSIADYVEGLDSAQQKANVLRQLAGRGGLELIPFFSKSREGLEEAEGKAYAPSPADMARLQRSQESMNTMRRTWENAKTRLASGAASEVGSLGRLFSGDGSVYDFANALLLGIPGTIAAKHAQRFVRPARDLTPEETAAAESEAGQAAWLEKADQLEASLKKKMAAIGGGPMAEAIADLAPHISPSRRAALENVAQQTEGRNLAESLTQHAQSLQDQINAFGKAFDTAELEMAIRKGGGAVTEAVADVQGKMMELAGAQLRQELGGPVGAFGREQSRLGKLVDAGEIEYGDFEAALGKAALPLLQSAGTPQLAGAAEAGTTAGYSAIAQALQSGGKVDVGAAIESAKTIWQEQLDELKRIGRDAAQNGPPIELPW
jgi:hypothetical protein